MTFFFDHDVLEDAAFALEAMGHQVVGLCQVLPMKGVTRLAKATAGQFNIGVSICRNLFPIPIAPLNEQLRIVETLDELFSDLDAGVAALERVRTKLRHYRAAVLRRRWRGR